MSFTRQPERWSAVCDGCGFVVDNLSQPSAPDGWTTLKHWGRDIKRDDTICVPCSKSIEVAIGATFNERQSLRGEQS